MPRAAVRNIPLHGPVFLIGLAFVVAACSSSDGSGDNDRADSGGDEPTESASDSGRPSQRRDPSNQPFVDGDTRGAAPTGAARIFFTDLRSGPNQGGEGNAGVFVTIRGKGLGATQGQSTVTVGGGLVAAYKSWSDTEVVVQLGAEARTGDIIVRTPRGNSNGMPFTVRAGAIFFVATNGDDRNDGSFAAPWRTIVKAKDSIEAGATVYIRDGVSQTREDDNAAALSIESSGANGAPKALIAYPGAKVTIGSTSIEFGIRVPNNDLAANDWVIAKLILRGGVQAMDIGGNGSSRWRVIGNDISCPNGDGQTGCFAAGLASYIVFLGNDVHDIGKQSRPLPSKQYHAVYFTTDTNHVEVGWNHIRDNNTCRALQFHSSPLDNKTGLNQFDLIVHDNLIHGDVCDGINFATVDPSKGPVRAYNNVIYNVGRGPDPPDGDANYACIYVAAGTNTGPDGRGEVEIFNNTLVDCGARKNESAGALHRGPGSPGLIVSLKNNVVVVVSGQSYFAPDALRVSAQFKGSNNLFFGGGAAPSFLEGNVGADPRFVNAGAFDFHLQAGSPAIDAGASVAIASDFDGVPRTGRAPDIGAYEHAP